MNKRDEVRRHIEIIWADFPEQEYLKRGFGHGVELIYENGANRYVIGFIDGFSWLHGFSNQAVVFVRSKDSVVWNDISVNYEDLINDVKESARIVVDTEQFVGRLKGNIYPHING